MKNENKLDEMVSILDALHKFYGVVNRMSDNFHHILFGGDQVTVV